MVKDQKGLFGGQDRMPKVNISFRKILGFDPRRKDYGEKRRVEEEQEGEPLDKEDNEQSGQNESRQKD